MTTNNSSITLTSFNKLLYNYRLLTSKKYEKSWKNEDIIYNRDSYTFVDESDINLVKDIYLKSPIKDILGQEFCNLLWDYITFYEDVKDEYYTKHDDFIFICNWYIHSATDEYRIICEEIVTKLYTSPQFNKLINFMNRNNINYYYYIDMNKVAWVYYDNYTSYKKDIFNSTKIQSYSFTHNITRICEMYLHYIMDKVKVQKDKEDRRILFNTIMNKNGVTCDDNIYNKYLEWTVINGIGKNRYQKMMMFVEELKQI